MNTPKTAQEIHETLYDGVDLVVTLQDGSTRTVKVRKIARKDFPAFAGCFGNEENEAAFYLGWSPDQETKPAIVEQLSEESFDAVMQEGHRLNFTRFSHWFGRQIQRLGAMKDSGAVKTAMTLLEASPQLQKLLGTNPQPNTLVSTKG